MSGKEIVNTDELSLEQIRELANKETGADEPIEGVVEEVEEPEQPKKTVFRKEIDLGDGSGIQVFEADSLEGLVDKLADAQLNATKKIREQAAQLKSKPKEPEKVQEPEISEDEEFVLSQELIAHPTVAMKKMFKKMTGYDLSEFRTVAERAKAFETAQAQQQELARQNDAATAFIAAHPEYVANQSNGARLNRAVDLLVAEAKAHGQEVDYSTLLEQAYQDLSNDGLLKLKSNDANDNDVTVDEEPTGAVKPRIVATEEVASTQRRKASGLSSRGRNTTTGRFEANEEDLYNMPLEKLRELANKNGM